MTQIVYKWQIYCNTEDKFVQGYGTSEPTTCYNDHYHEVNPDSVQQLEQYTPDSVIVEEEKIPTGGHFTQDTLSFNCPKDEITCQNCIFQYPITLYGAVVYTDLKDIGNLLDVDIEVTKLEKDEWTTTTSPKALVFDENYFSKVFVGTYITLKTADVETPLGRITALYPDARTVEFENPIPEIGEEDAQLIVSQTLLKNHKLIKVGYLQINFGNLYGINVPKNTNIRIRYYNNLEDDSLFSVGLRYNY